MGLYLFRLPDVGEGIAEAEIVLWHVQSGDVVREDDNLVDVMTDKATVEMTSPVDGVVKAVHGEAGSMCRVGSVLVEMEVEGAGNAEGRVAPDAATLEAHPPKVQENAEEREAIPSQAREDAAPQPEARAPRSPLPTAPLASPATRRRAHDLGIALHYVRGTGPGGRIMADDLDAFVAQGKADAARGGGAALAAPRHGVVQRRLIGLRRRIAERMEEAARRIPHMGYVEEIDMTELEALRADLNAHRAEGQERLTLLPFLMRALVRVLPAFPQINALYDEAEGVLHEYEGVHIGIATQTPAGLVVPVVRHVEARDIRDCAAELARVSTAAREGRAAREELSGSTNTLTSLGALGGVATSPIINAPEVAILGPNRLVERPVVRYGTIAIRKMMNLSCAFDHRIVDGHDAARFVQQLKRLLEHPALIFMEEG